jgi:hypothetical protein
MFEQSIFSKKDFERVLIHELGHFFANELNNEVLELSRANKIRIYPCSNNATVLCGEIVYELPEFAKPGEVTPPDRLHFFIGKAIMGCVFQSYFERKITFTDCFNIYGQGDCVALNKNKSYKRSSSEMRKLSEAEDRFYNRVRSTQCLEFLFNINIDEELILKKEDNEWQVDLAKLRKILNGLDTDIFRSIYRDFLEELRQIINE